MSFETAQSLRVTIKEVDEAVRQGLLAGDVLDVMSRRFAVVSKIFRTHADGLFPEEFRKNFFLFDFCRHYIVAKKAQTLDVNFVETQAMALRAFDETQGNPSAEESAPSGSRQRRQPPGSPPQNPTGTITPIPPALVDSSVARIDPSPAVPIATSPRVPIATSSRVPIASSSRAPIASSSRAPIAPSSRAPIATSSSVPIATSSRVPIAPSLPVPIGTSPSEPIDAFSRVPIGATRRESASTRGPRAVNDPAAPIEAPARIDPPASIDPPRPPIDPSLLPIASSHAAPIDPTSRRDPMAKLGVNNQPGPSTRPFGSIEDMDVDEEDEGRRRKRKRHDRDGYGTEEAQEDGEEEEEDIIRVKPEGERRRRRAPRRNPVAIDKYHVPRCQRCTRLKKPCQAKENSKTCYHCAHDKVGCVGKGGLQDVPEAYEKPESRSLPRPQRRRIVVDDNEEEESAPIQSAPTESAPGRSAPTESAPKKSVVKPPPTKKGKAKATDADYLGWDVEARLEERLAKVETAIGRMARFEARLKSIEGKFGMVDSSLSWMEERQDKWEAKQAAVEERQDETDIAHMDLGEWQGGLNRRLIGLEDYLGMPHETQMISLRDGQARALVKRIRVADRELRDAQLEEFHPDWRNEEQLNQPQTPPPLDTPPAWALQEDTAPPESAHMARLAHRGSASSPSAPQASASAAQSQPLSFPSPQDGGNLMQVGNLASANTESAPPESAPLESAPPESAPPESAPSALASSLARPLTPPVLFRSQQAHQERLEPVAPQPSELASPRSAPASATSPPLVSPQGGEVTAIASLLPSTREAQEPVCMVPSDSAHLPSLPARSAPGPSGYLGTASPRSERALSTSPRQSASSPQRPEGTCEPPVPPSPVAPVLVVIPPTPQASQEVSTCFAPPHPGHSTLGGQPPTSLPPASAPTGSSQSAQQSAPPVPRSASPSARSSEAPPLMPPSPPWRLIPSNQCGSALVPPSNTHLTVVDTQRPRSMSPGGRRGRSRAPTPSTLRRSPRLASPTPLREPTPESGMAMDVDK